MHNAGRAGSSMLQYDGSFEFSTALVTATCFCTRAFIDVFRVYNQFSMFCLKPVNNYLNSFLFSEYSTWLTDLPDSVQLHSITSM